MGWMTTTQRQEVFLGYFRSNPAVSLDDYASGFPKDRLYIRGIIKGTHYALETVLHAHDLYNKSDSDLFAKYNTNELTAEDLPAFLAALERVNLVLRWMLAIRKVESSFGKRRTA